MRIGMAQRLTKLAFILLATNMMAAAQQNNPPTGTPPPPPLKLTSTAFSDSTAYPHQYTCAADPNIIKRGPGTSPPLQWSDVPEETVSFVLIFHDLDPRLEKSSE